LPPPPAVTGPWQTEREEWEQARQEITSALKRANQVLAKKKTGALMR
jgi:DNA integrity scanning protein DisA with diadenylate cyclase activity